MILKIYLNNLEILKVIILIYKIFFIFFLITNYSWSYSTTAIDIFSPKKSTPNGLMINTITKPDEFYLGNDLTRKVGSFYVSVGELLYLKGIITDAFGVPIENATVQIWHTNSSGHYQSLLKNTDEYYDENFLMSGTVKTDNLGRYGFKTIFPGYFENRAPHINIIVKHPKFGKIETEIYFEKHPLNEKDPYYMSYDEEDKKMLTAKVKTIDALEPERGKIAIFDIVMDGIHSYKGY